MIKLNLQKVLGKLCAMLVICTAFTNIISCSANPKLNIISPSYPELITLTAAEPDKTVINTWCYADNPYIGHFCNVTVENGNLIITDRDEEQRSHIMTMNYGYFTGVNLGEFGGFCKYYRDGETIGELVSSENCYGLIKPKRSNNLGYMISGTWNMLTTGNSSIYKLTQIDNTPKWQYDVIATFDSTPRCYHYSETNNTLYIVTWTGLLKADLNNGDTVPLYSSELWNDMTIKSIVELNDKLYLGAAMGVLEYDLKTGTSNWYPMDYEKYLPSK